MKGIMLKDLYENFYIKKNLVAYIFASLFFIVASAVMDTRYSFILYTMLLMIFFGTSVLETSSEQDDKAHFHKIQFTFPVTKSEIVISKYLLALICNGCWIMIALVYVLANVYLRPLVTLAEALTVWGLGICASLAFTSLIYVFYFLLGRKIGTVIYIASALILGGMYGASTVFFGIESYTSTDTAVRLLFLLPASVVLYVLSCMLSILIYKKKYS